MDKQLRAGWGEAEITPDFQNLRIELAGQYYQRLAEGRHSPLKTVALALSQDDLSVVMISLDTVSVTPDYCDRLRRFLTRRIPELSTGLIMINATHTHSAPSLKPARNWWPRDPQALTVESYQDIVEDSVASAVEAAWKTRQPSGTAAVLESARIGHCRRAVYANGTAEMYGRTDRRDFLGMEGGEDSGLDLLFFFDHAGQPTGVVVNLACPSQVMEATYLISSDFMGALREKLKAHFGPDFHTLCQVSAAGCQSPRDLTRCKLEQTEFWGPDGVEILAERLRAAILRSAPGAASRIDSQPNLASSSSELSLPRRRVDYPDFKAASQALKRLEDRQPSAAAYRDFCRQLHDHEKIPGYLPPYDDKLHHFVQIRNLEAVVKRYREQNTNPYFQMLLQVVRVGSVVFATNPFELFLDYGHRIKSRSPALQTFVVQLANGSGGYLPSPRAETLGGYGGLIVNGQTGADGGAMMVDQTVKKIKCLWT